MTDDSNLELKQAIRRAIASSSQQRITFAEYMELALYHPTCGYYTTKAVQMGKQGDFFTSTHLGADFGELLAEQFVQMWQILGKPQPFTLVEMGAGQGFLALDLLKYVQLNYPEFFAVLDYIIVEQSPALRELQQQTIPPTPLEKGGKTIPPTPLEKGGNVLSTTPFLRGSLPAGGSIRWCSLEEIPDNSIAGCFFSNELIDALPVHQIAIERGVLREVYVGQGKQGGQGSSNSSHQPLATSHSPFTEITEKLSTPRLQEYFDLVGIDITSSTYPDGYRSEVNLAALDWLQSVAQKLQCGYVLTIDYGYPASRYYNPARSQGTLQCYYQHHHHNDPYINIGQQDITAHVDFTALQRWGDRCGLPTVGFTQQGLFLMALGLGDRIAALSQTTSQSLQQVLWRRDALHQLLDPMGLGGFGVLIQSRGLTETEVAQPLMGLK
ncbi:SAM-dependent methyltransferase [Chroococcidiopsis cubana SAG 39.79]|uniref:SAM-dependent methyltransferase n=3 Tax=Chroococcidiopsis TaxID=54298 RepID=A0AB37UQ68_9CYAN|nr:class I SAM-dependent methyltransferase [Chroococcidiopsis cubana]RUT13562.1 SAM-dependent methyltransferase [Chroococcidiopsis cubana SAG 39.79]